MKPSSSHQEALIAALDGLYEQLIDEAHRLAAAYFEDASTGEEGAKRHVKLMIRVRRHTDQSWGIYWANNKGSPKEPKPPRTINKGAGTKYPLSTFSRLKEPHKTLCRNYEKKLTAIREACADNRALRRTLAAHGRVIERLTEGGKGAGDAGNGKAG